MGQIDPANPSVLEVSHSGFLLCQNVATVSEARLLTSLLFTAMSFVLQTFDSSGYNSFKCLLFVLTFFFFPGQNEYIKFYFPFVVPESEPGDRVMSAFLSM